MKIALLTAALVFAVSSAFAADVSSSISKFNLSHVHSESLSVVTSQQNESLKDFLLNDVRPVLRAFSDKTDFEGCGELAYNSTTKQYSVMLFSSKSHLACVVDPTKIEPNSTALNVTIHSHGQEAPFNLNRADRVFTGMELDTRPIIVGGENNEHFSQTDYQGGPGFLATPATVKYQNGHPGSECDVKSPGCVPAGF